MVYERTLRSQKQLRDELRGLEVDAGVRASGTFEGTSSLIFVTKHSGTYSVWIRANNRRDPARGRFKAFRSFSELSDFLEDVLDRPLKAHIY